VRVCVNDFVWHRNHVLRAHVRLTCSLTNTIKIWNIIFNFSFLYPPGFHSLDIVCLTDQHLKTTFLPSFLEPNNKRKYYICTILKEISLWLINVIRDATQFCKYFNYQRPPNDYPCG